MAQSNRLYVVGGPKAQVWYNQIARKSSLLTETLTKPQEINVTDIVPPADSHNDSVLVTRWLRHHNGPLPRSRILRPGFLLWKKEIKNSAARSVPGKVALLQRELVA
jgi:hypothetical protein